MLTYEESATLMQDLIFRGRVKVAALRFANYIETEPSEAPAHNTRLRWAISTFQQPDMAAQSLHGPVVMDAAVQEAGAEVTDAALQSAVEGVVNKMM